MKQLPKYYAIRRDENDPLWAVYRSWVGKESGTYQGWIDWPYVGFDGNRQNNGFNAKIHHQGFFNPVTIITLADWAEVTGNLPEESDAPNFSTNFTEVMTGKSGGEPTPETVQFDPSKPFETYWNGVWNEPEYFQYIGVNSIGKYVIERLENNVVMCFDKTKVRNIQPFNASMLEVGEYMETESGVATERNLIKCISDSPWTYIDIRHGGGLFYCDIASELVGRRVKVEHKIVEG